MTAATRHRVAALASRQGSCLLEMWECTPSTAQSNIRRLMRLSCPFFGIRSVSQLQLPRAPWNASSHIVQHDPIGDVSITCRSTSVALILLAQHTGQSLPDAIQLHPAAGMMIGPLSYLRADLQRMPQ
jgi:hypothetical protein